MAKKKKDGEVELKDILGTASMFRSRLNSKVVDIGGVKFTISALPSLLTTYISSISVDDGGKYDSGMAIVLYLRHGITNIEGLLDEEGKPIEFKTYKVNLIGREFNVIEDSLLDGLPPGILVYLGSVVSAVMSLSEEELNKLDFTIRSRSNTSPATKPVVAKGEKSNDATGAQTGQ